MFITDSGAASLSIEPEALAARLDGGEAIRLVDASWHMPAAGRDPHAEYEAAHLPGAVFWDLERHCDRSSPYPHMMPAPEVFARAMGDLGIGEGDTVVTYDHEGVFAAPRLWWMLRSMGHRGAIHILQGGLAAWRQAGLPIESTATDPQVVRYTPRPIPASMVDVEQLRAALAQNVALLDARSFVRFAGRETEPRPGVRPGHIPGAIHLHYAQLLEGTPARFKTPASLRESFHQAGIDPARAVIASCGSGVTACILAAGLTMIGAEKIAVYDGSWAEWGSRADLPCRSEAV